MVESEHEPRGYPEHSYIRRRGRMTKAQARAFDSLFATYVIPPEQLTACAGGRPIGIEIGFGMGHALLEWAAAEPASQLFGIELYEPGVGALLDGLAREQLDNVRVLQQPAQQVFAAIGDASVTEIRIFFPDPWPKKRHHKRRLIQPPFVAELARVLVSGGTLRLATDWTPYAEWMRECLQGEPALAVVMDNVRAAGSSMAPDSERQSTNFERRGERLGHDIHDLIYVKAD